MEDFAIASSHALIRCSLGAETLLADRDPLVLTGLVADEVDEASRASSSPRLVRAWPRASPDTSARAGPGRGRAARPWGALSCPACGVVV